MLKLQSIRQRLLLGLLGSFVLIWLLIAVMAYKSSSHESQEIYDAALASYARIIASLMVHEAEEEQELEEQLSLLIKELGNDIVLKSSVLANLKKTLDIKTEEDYMSLDLTANIKGHSYESQFAFIILNKSGKVMLRSRHMTLQTEFRQGFFNTTAQNQSWRVFGLELKESGMQVLVGENLEIRNELQDIIIVNLLWPFMILLPVLGIVIWLAIKKGLGPLERITNTIANRNPRSLSPIKQDSVPEEITPLINALNSLFIRIDKAIDNEKRFTANAAHELRTPLAALKTHAQVIELNANDKIQSNVNQMIESINRSSHLVEQLLTLSKAEANFNNSMQLHSVDLVSVVKTQLGEFSSKALEKGITPSFKADRDSYMVMADETLLHVVIRNLLDNAIQYSDKSGQLDVGITKVDDKIQLTFQDDGPGIEEEKINLMTQRFQRGDHPDNPGAGLGLYIVKQIMDIFNASLNFFNKQPTGLIVQLEFKTVS